MRPPFFKTVIIFGLAPSLLAWGLNTAEPSEEEAARIIYLKGSVKVQHPGDVFWVLAKKGMTLTDKDKIKTFVASEAEIALDSTLKNIVRIEPNAEITLESLKMRRLYLPKGKVLSLIEALPADSSFEVRTATAVAGVAGSGISVDTDGRKTNVKCFEDKAYVKGIDVDGNPMREVVIIDEGFKRIISKFEMPGGQVILTALERENWSQFRQQLREHLDSLREKRAEGSRAAALAIHEIGRMRQRYEETQEQDEDIYID